MSQFERSSSYELDQPLPMAGRLLTRPLSNLAQGRLTVELGKHQRVFQGEDTGLNATMRVRNPWTMLRRIAMHGSMGFAEAYIAGDWDSPDLSELLHLLLLNQPSLEKAWKGPNWSRLKDRFKHLCQANNRKGSRRNIRYHYDLGNDFYRLWLDRSMTYSCALFDPKQQEEALEAAQERKYRRLLDMLHAKPGDHILEIGCGWGGLAEMAARDGYQVTCITLSEEQMKYAAQRIQSAGLADRVSFRLQDYRDVSEHFDHVVSIEMFEAVGESYWPTFFQTLTQRLRPGGRCALQTITIDESIFPQYRRQADFIQRYIFPGGMLPASRIFREHVDTAGLVSLKEDFFGLDYAKTLAHWHQMVQEKAEVILQMGYDHNFMNMWRYYLSYCEAGFRGGRIDLMQTLLQKPA